MSQHTNQLIHETSPYLLQHAHNPVNWYPWNDDALNRAKAEDKPILVSIGYAACHWCHVMEKESFEDETTAKIMNDNFICIKIDREERPDLDHIYMDAVQSMTGSGGWPLNVFLTPETKPFYGGTYFPPRRAFNRPSWTELLTGIAASFREKRKEINEQANTLTDHLIRSNSFGLQSPNADDEIFLPANMDETFDNLMKNADKELGGFGQAPKFPQTFSIQFLLRYHYVQSRKELKQTTEASNETVAKTALEQALLSLDKMIDGGIYDQIGGGFARYSTDAEWLAPHFEKMLYDNALLLIVLSEAYQLTKKPRYKEVIDETMEFIKRELVLDANNKSPKDPTQTGFYSALDADSEGEEGKFYVWNLQEVNEVLGNDSDLFCDYYDISSWGNWEGKNILRVKQSIEHFANKRKMSIEECQHILADGRKKLLAARNKRIRPLLDDKSILGWNALMNTACSRAFAATGNESFREMAIGNMHFLLARFQKEGEAEFYHTWKNGQAKYPAFLGDYSFLVQALISLQEITGERDWLRRAREITQFVIDQFSEPDTGLFFFTKTGQVDVIVRKKEIYDGAIPSGNAIMAQNLYQLSILFAEEGWKERSFKMVSAIAKMAVKYPGSFGIWATLIQEIINGTNEIVLMGENVSKMHLQLLEQYLPHRVLMVSETAEPGFPLLAGKPLTGLPSLWLCRNFRCLSPVSSVKALIALIDSPESLN